LPWWPLVPGFTGKRSAAFFMRRFVSSDAVGGYVKL
jgi:hypothetical protein